MNRRGFLAQLGAMMSAPAMPSLGILAGTQTPAPAQLVNASYNSHMYGHALALMRQAGTIGKAEFQKLVGYNTAQCDAILSAFSRHNLISASAFETGMVNAVKPRWLLSSNPSTITKLPSKIHQGLERDLTQAQHNIADDITQDDPPAVKTPTDVSSETPTETPIETLATEETDIEREE